LQFNEICVKYYYRNKIVNYQEIPKLNHHLIKKISGVSKIKYIKTFVNLEHLKLEKLKNGLVHTNYFPHLKILEIECKPKISIKQIKNFKYLEEIVFISNCKIDLRPLTQLKYLNKVKFCNDATLNKNDVLSLINISNLTCVGDFKIAENYLNFLTKLEVLNMKKSIGTIHINNLKNLIVLKMYFLKKELLGVKDKLRKMSISNLQDLGDVYLPSLQSLTVKRWCDNLKIINKQPNLTELKIKYFINEDTFSGVNLQKLTSLKFKCGNIYPKFLENLYNLRILHLYDYDDDLECIKKLKLLEELVITGFLNEEIDILSKLNNLKKVKFRNDFSKSLLPLSSLHKLEEVNLGALHNCDLTPIESLKNLKIITIVKKERIIFNKDKVEVRFIDDDVQKYYDTTRILTKIKNKYGATIIKRKNSDTGKYEVVRRYIYNGFNPDTDFSGKSLDSWNGDLSSNSSYYSDSDNDGNNYDVDDETETEDDDQDFTEESD